MQVPYSRQKVKRRWKPLLAKKTDWVPPVNESLFAFICGLVLFLLLLNTGILWPVINSGHNHAEKWFLFSGDKQIKLPEEPEVMVRRTQAVNKQLASYSLPWEEKNTEAEESSPLTVYQVQGGDAIGQIARNYGLQAETLIQLNQLSGPQDLYPGRMLLIPSRDGFRYKLSRRETPLSAASKWNVELKNMIELEEERNYFIPGKPESVHYWDKVMRYPLNGDIIQGYGLVTDPLTGVETEHKGLDILAAPGEMVTAVDRGRVVERGVHSFFGKYIIMSHPNGFQSFYGHLESFTAQRGEFLEKGDEIGIAGNTGQVSQIQLHFSLFHNEKMVDPTGYLY